MLSNIFRYAWNIIRNLKDQEFRGLLVFVFGILASGTLFYHAIEKWRWLDSLYFSVTTLTTVGYGDIAPATDAGKIFTIIYIFVGVGVILGFINTVARHAKDDNGSNGANSKRAWKKK